MARIVTFLFVLLAGIPAFADEDMAPREGWKVYPTERAFDALLQNLTAAAKANKMIIVTQAGPTKAAKARGIEIPENRVLGLFNNQFAVEILRLSTAAMIEAPMRMYLTENADGTATLSYKLPSFVSAPYADEGGAELADAAARLDAIFEAIALDATR
ncbi:DUF302 domain-containing protein [Ovoidimarina sediminis]|uniref:DUF302 domain-containing protein n=1 Tax=Ovoidimarina sediminis TaxID=3079856 RepID=UPI00290CAD47|nr:DUF302 domain-containing protein [Rhodophyticola sp. MJ-SS7]MDU8943761.1 DUF302 domain-containing protein [Rhodophyticola sp. MJ-SS7]